MDVTVEGLNAVTREYRIGTPSIEDITDTYYLLELLKARNSLTVQGGTTIQERVRLHKGRRGGFYTGADPVSHVTSQPYSYASYPWCHQYEPAAVLFTDILKCSGPEAVIDLLQDESISALQRMILCQDDAGNVEGLAKDIFNTLNTSDAAAAKKFCGIGRMLTTNRELGGITSNTASARIDQWNPHVVDMGPDAGDLPLTVPKIAQTIRDTIFGKNGPTVGIYTPALMERLETIFQTYVRYRNEELKQIRGGVENILILGVPITEDRNIITPAYEEANGGQIWFLDLDSFKMVFHSDDFMKTSEWVKAENQFAYQKDITLTMTLSYKRPRTNAKMYDINPIAV